MNDPSKSFGGLPKEAISAAQAASFGQAEKVIQSFVPDFRLLKNEHTVFDIKVEVSGTGTIRVSAPNKHTAMEIAKDYDICDIDMDAEYSCEGISNNQGAPADLIWAGDD